MERDGLMECREEEEAEEVGDSVWWKSNRTTVPAVSMRMRHVPRLELAGEIQIEGATLVVVRPTIAGTAETDAEEQVSDAALAFGAFGGVYGEAVEKLLKSRSYLLEMNSF